VSPSPTPGKGLFLGWTGSVLVYANGDEDRLLPGATGPSKQEANFTLAPSGRREAE